MVHPRGFSFQAQRKIVMLRDIQKLKWADIAKQVKNLQNCHPKPRLCAIYYHKFQSKLGRSPTKYHKCGPRAPYKADADVKKFRIGRMLKERAKNVCTSVTLQLALAQEKGLLMVALTISWGWAGSATAWPVGGLKIGNATLLSVLSAWVDAYAGFIRAKASV